MCKDGVKCAAIVVLYMATYVRTCTLDLRTLS